MKQLRVPVLRRGVSLRVCRSSLGSVFIASILIAAGGLMPVGHLAWGAQSAKEIVLIGGVKSHGPAQHDFPNGIRLLKDFLQTSPDLEALGTNVAAYPDGWPGEHVALENASTIVWYFDGLGA